MESNQEKLEYNFICSLGGNCAAAHNLSFYKLRKASYPFDWTYFNSEEAVYRLADSFANGFKNYLIQENLKELPVNPSHPDKIQYEDTYGKIVWANHFIYGVDKNKNYKSVKAKYNRRFKRLLNSIKKSKNILFIFSTSFYVKQDAFRYLLGKLNELYPEKNFKIKVLSFGCQNEEKLIEENLEIFYYKRSINEDDFLKTNKEWDFLKSIFLNNSSITNIFKKIFKRRIYNE